MTYTYKRKKKNSAYRKKVRKTQRGGAPLALLATRFGPKAAKRALKNPGLAKKALSMNMSKGMGKGMGKNLTGLMNNPKLKSIVNDVISSFSAPAPEPEPETEPVKTKEVPTENKVKGGSKRKTKRRRGGGICSATNGGSKKSRRRTRKNKKRTRRNSRK